eukprot:Skav229564  [mRNA]  locus=scaffold568:553802:558148:+ [translate_table: standard]
MPQVQIADYLREQGFVELQEWALATQGTAIQKTCKQSTTKDFMWISRELVPWIKSVSVDHTWFSDHAILYANMHMPDMPSTVPIWRTPHSIDWTSIQLDSAASCPEVLTKDTHEAYKILWQAAEDLTSQALVAKELPGLTVQQCGRAQTQEVQWIQTNVTPLKRPRHQDPSTAYAGEHWQRYHWVRQLRRLHHYVHLSRHNTTNAVLIEQSQLWTSVLRSKGFPGGFRAFWLHRSVRHIAAPFTIPKGPPTHSVAALILSNFQAEVAAFEKVLKHERLQKAKHRRLQNQHVVFQDIARPRALPVQNLVTSIVATITEVDEDRQNFTYDPPHFDPSQPVHSPCGILPSFQHIPGHVASTVPMELEVGDVANDPGFQAVWLSVQAFRRYADISIAYPIIDSLTLPFQHPTRQTPGPCHALIQRLCSIAWTWYQDGWFSDHQGFIIHIMDSPIQLLKQRISHGWRCKIASEAASRPSMQGLQQVDVEFTLQQWPKLTDEQQGLLRVVHNGAFYTRDKLCHTGAVDSPQCPWCQAEDSVHHRHFECPGTRHLQAEPIPEFDTLPACTRNHGWFVQPPAILAFQKELCQLPDTTKQWEVAPPPTDVLHLFTDGGCIKPTEPRLRLATWGVVNADILTDTYVPIARGAVPGLLQTATRAEAYAAIAALEYSIYHQIPCIIWLDNARVHRKLEAFRLGQPPPGRMSKDHDLWNRLWSLVQTAMDTRLFLRAVKVRAHEDHRQVQDPVEAWALIGNEYADAEATAARRDLPSQLLQSWGCAHQAHQTQVEQRTHLHRLFQTVGAWAVQNSSTKPAATEVRPEDPAPADDDALQPILMPAPAWEDRRTDVHLGEYGQIVFDWLVDCQTQPATNPVWVTTYQLLILFQAHSRRIGPVRRGTTKVWIPGEQYWAELGTFDFVKQASSFGQFIRWIGIMFRLNLGMQHRRPAGNALRGWHRCYPVRLTPDQVERADHHIVHTNGGVPVVNVKADMGLFFMFTHG